jgi:hypothetical protein
MAHEIGHLLLRYREHSSEGIMRRNWPSTDLQSAAQARLRFTAEQSQRMRDEVRRWSEQPAGPIGCKTIYAESDQQLRLVVDTCGS